MDCSSCAEHVKRALERVDGVSGVEVDVVSKSARVRYRPHTTDHAALVRAVEEAGYGVSKPVDGVLSLVVDGLDCSEEIRRIERALAERRGITRLRFNLLNHELQVEGSTTASEIIAVLQSIGLAARVNTGAARSAKERARSRGPYISTLLSGASLALGLTISAYAVSQTAAPFFALAMVSGGWFVVPRGYRALRAGLFDMNLLMTIAALGAALIGEWAEGASVMFLFAVAQLLESHSMERARLAIEALMELSPADATVRRGTREQTVPVGEVEIGEIIVIRPGSKIPLDGEVVRGRSAVNEAAITGESLPLEKSAGSTVYAGSLNEHGALDVRVTKHVTDTTLARIIHTVEEAQASRAPTQSLVDRFASVYTPTVIVLAALIAVLPPLAAGGQWSVWFYRALAMLVIACPCALVISTPVSIVSGLAGAARAGVLIKGGVHLENLGRLTAVLFDKTGTLTEGRPTVSDIVPLGERSEDDVLALAAGLEAGSEHPLARAIVDEARRRSIQPAAASDFRALVGSGARAVVAGRVHHIGNRRLTDEVTTLTPDAERRLTELEAEGKTATVLSDESGPLAIIAIADRVRAGARDAVAALRRQGVGRLLMLTGDNAATAHAVSREVGISEVHSKLLPDDKLRIVTALATESGRVAFVGDGVNDAPALAAATVGITLGAAGTDVALETADVALMTDDLSKLPRAVQAGRATLSIVKQNIAFAIAVKALFLVLAVLGYATLWMAVASDMGASLVVIGNALRALHAADRAA